MEQTIACEKKGSTDMKAENKAFLTQIIKDSGGPTWDIDSVKMKAENKAFLEQLREPPKKNRSKVTTFFLSFKSKIFSKNFPHPEK
jgi:hypothetical protein